MSAYEVPDRHCRLRRLAIASSVAACLVAPPSGGLFPAMAIGAEKGITVAPDGSVWAGTTVRHPDGTFRTYRVPSTLSDVAVGPDGNLWGIEWCGRVVRLTPAGRVTTFPSGQKAVNGECDDKAILAGRDGNMWFTHDDAIGRIALNTPAADEGCTTPTISGPRNSPTGFTCGLYSLFRIPEYAFDATWGADGAVWFTTDIGYGSPGAIGRFDITTHRARIRRVGTLYDEPSMLTATSDGDLWFTMSQSARLGRMTPDGTAHWLTLRGVHSDGDITTGADGRIWFPCATDRRRQAICRVDPGTLKLRVFPRPADGYSDDGIAAAPDGHLWFTQSGRGVLGRISPSGVVQDYPPTVTITGMAQMATRSVRVRLRCPAAQGEPCTGPIQLWSTGSWNRAGAAHYVIAPGATATLVLPLWSPARRALLRTGRLRVVVTTRGNGLTSSEPPGITLHTARHRR